MKDKLRLTGARLAVFFSSGRRLVAAAAVLHVALATGLFFAGRAQIAPSLIDRDGIMASFAPDSYEYRSEAVRLEDVLQEDGIRAWAASPERAHTKLLSLQFACFARLFGHSILSAEPFNLFCYVAILILVLMLGREAGGRRAGLFAASVVAVWPTFLLHTMQFLKDPLFIAATLAVILIVLTWLTRTYSSIRAFVMGVLLAAASGLLLLIRVKFAGFILAVACFGFALLIVRQWRERRLLCWNMICPVLILSVGSVIAFYPATVHHKQKRYPSDQSGLSKSAAVAAGEQLRGVISYPASGSIPSKMSRNSSPRSLTIGEKIVFRIGGARADFNVSYAESGSSIDRGVELNNFKDVIFYLPRAFAIGFWSPFPGAWISAGKQVGRAGRLLSGAETLFIYLCQLLALIAIWRAPRSLANWLLLSIAASGMIALGLIVSNVGTLYRFRYLFWIMLIILGVKGGESLLTMWRAGNSDSPQVELPESR
jgi:4-amino-4-deoxy-L-arabinose transferase-like glycosyltransferase